ncbi:MAG: thioredoxin domain-containing protein [Eubacteriales bacterium]|nr:thioredoxin domain-containing protein [Eubacteriales bacterium]
MTDSNVSLNHIKQHLKHRLVQVMVPIMLFGILTSGILLLTACGKPSPVGPIDDNASLSVLSFETIDASTSGIVYRTIEDFPAWVAQTKVPVLLVFYDPMDPINTRVIPRIEQLADDYQNQLAIVWIDATVESKLAHDFQVEKVPQFTMLVGAAIKRSLVGYGENGEELLDRLIAAYLNT